MALLNCDNDERDSSTVQGLGPLQITSMNEAIQGRLMQFMREQGLSAGSRLPSENMLARSLGVSRTALREAMRSLEALGVVESRVGSGWYMREPSFDAVAQALSLSLELNRKTLEGLEQVRISLESSFIIPAVRRMSEEDIAELRRLSQEMLAQAHLGRGYFAQDYAFHKQLFSPLDNPVLDKLIDLFFTVYQYCRISNSRQQQEVTVEVAQQHERLVEAIVAGDEALIRQRMRESLAALYCESGAPIVEG